MKTLLHFIALAILFLLAACAAPGRHTDLLPPPPQVLSPAASPPPTPAPGSLWAQNHNSLYYDLKARNIGDILTVAISESASASKEASTDTNRESGVSADLTRVFGLEKIIDRATSAEPTAMLAAKSKNDFSGKGATTRKENLLASISTQVVEVLPNGNLRIQGGKTVTVNNESQIIQLTGIVRPDDISAKNIIDSKYILDARIAYVGKGPISDKQQPGWLTHVVDVVWPF